jgi:hypothetical protein
VAISEGVAKAASSKSQVCESIAEARKSAIMYQNELPKTAPWTARIPEFLKGAPYGGWGHPAKSWPLPECTKVYTTTRPCTDCKGKKSVPCDVCRSQGQMPCSRCRVQWTGQLPGYIQCPVCYGSARNQNDPSQVCLNCHMMPGFVLCPDCARGGAPSGYLTCHSCKGHGFISCTTCRATGNITEEVKVEVALFTEFALDPLNHLPASVFTVIDKMTPEDIAIEAKIEPDAADVKQGLAYKATLPYAKLKLTVKGVPYDVTAFGNTPRLADVPKLLDESLAEATATMNADTLLTHAEQFKLIGDLTKAMAAGQTALSFYRENYPYGISRDFALGLAASISKVFAKATEKPRLIAAIVLTPVALVAFWVVKNYGLAALPPTIAPPVALGAIALFLAGIVWSGIDIAGRRALKKLVGKGGRSVSGFIGIVAALLFLAGAAGLFFLN